MLPTVSPWGVARFGSEYRGGAAETPATTASLVIVTVTSATALSAHARDGHVRRRTGLLFAAAGIGPAMLGGALAGRVPEALLTAAFALVAGGVALLVLRPRVTPDAAVTSCPGRAGPRLRGPGSAPSPASSASVGASSPYRHR
ncbi:sulfite exporter TauE/SafE [Streptomyces sp. SLBN-115]|nr:sulfite exporter TauE/SafE [Streptomyces sp. SLBN-115]